MNAASGDTANGGRTNPYPIVDGLSLEILCVLDLTCRGDTIPDVGLEGLTSRVGLAMAILAYQRTAIPLTSVVLRVCLSAYAGCCRESNGRAGVHNVENVFC
jgi:hypothetical protein